MPALVSDVGGTNTRLALVDSAGRLVSKPHRYRNDDHDGFLSAAKTFLGEQGGPDLSGACIAIAGPVSVKSARLTNRDWNFDSGEISQQLAIPGVRLINDIVALGHSLGSLSDDQISALRPLGNPVGNGQRLVVGIGTGLNVCMAKDMHGASAVMEAEFGHSALPVPVAARLDEAVAGASAQFATAEHLFSGRGVSRLFRLLSGETDVPAHVVAERAQEGGIAQECLALGSELLGLITRDIYLHYMPADGIYFAGTVARSLLQGPSRSAFLDAFHMQGQFEQDAANVPLSLITDDAAALSGCAQALI